jgi:hypothetical protein
MDNSEFNYSKVASMIIIPNQERSMYAPDIKVNNFGWQKAVTLQCHGLSRGSPGAAFFLLQAAVSAD